MLCDNAAEFVSALCDGEIIPRDAAEHIGNCEACQARLRDYLAMGVELRRTASLDGSLDESFEAETAVPQRSWARPQNTIAKWWQKGWGTMRIPRLAFAVMIAGILALASTLAVDKVRAHDAGTVVLLSVSTGSGEPIECALSTVDKKFGTCAVLGAVQSNNNVGYQIVLLTRTDNRMQLGIRTRVWRMTIGKATSYSLSDLDSEPQQQYWFEPGDTLTVSVPGSPPLTIKGNWLDHMPSFVGFHNFDPGPDELRIISPLLLQGKNVLGDLEGGASTQTKPDWAVWIYYPKQGSYLVSNSPLKDAIEADVNLNRISFAENGRSYSLLTGTPITRAQHVWILHQPAFDPSKWGQSGDYAFMSGQALMETAPGVWVPKNMPN